jgi:hypothetical protein
MSDKKFSEFDLITGETANTQLVGFDSLQNFRITPENIRKVIYPILGEITGTIEHAVDTDHDIMFGAGSCMDSSRLYMMMDSGMTKRLDASWSVGTGNGGLFSGSIDASKVYYMHKIRKDSDGSIDYGFSLSLTATDKPAGYTYYRCVGVGITDASSNWIQGVWIREGRNLKFKYKSYICDRVFSPALNNRMLLTVTAPANSYVHNTWKIIGVDAYVPFSMGETRETNTDPNSVDVAKGYSQGRVFTFTSIYQCDSNKQIYFRSGSYSNQNFGLTTEGWDYNL